LPYNSLEGATVGLSRCFVLAVIGGTDSVNEGFLRPIQVRTTPGTVMHATAPAPVSMFFYAGSAVEAVFVALAHAMPEKIAAGTGAGVQVLFAFGMNPDGTFWGGAFNMTSGQGAQPMRDGAAPMIAIGGGTMRAMSCEVFESRTPFVFDRFELGQDSAGIGAFRGSCGIDFEIRTRRELAATILIEGVHAERGYGVLGGGRARPNSGTVLYPDGRREQVGKVAGLPLPEGAVIDVQTGGGGGYGSPADRDAQLVHSDVTDGYVSEEAARAAYPHAFG
jgi:N-methylhydantoinase B